MAIPPTIAPAAAAPVGPPTPPTARKDIERMNPVVSFLIDLGVFWAPTAFVVYVGAMLGNIYGHLPGGALMSLSLWLGVLIGFRVLRIVKQQRYLLIERLGYNNGIKRRGLRLVIPGIDHVEDDGSFEGETRPLFDGLKDEARKEAQLIEFQDVSTGVAISYCATKANPADIEAGDWKAVAAQIARFNYEIRDPWRRADLIVDSSTRPGLEALRSDQAKLQKNGIATVAADEVRSLLVSEVGLYLRREKPIIIEDIKLSPEQVQARNLLLVGERKALEQAAEWAAPIHGAVAIMKAMDPKAVIPAATWEQSVDYAFRSRGFQVAESANLTLVGSNLGNVIPTLDVGAKGGG
jgi:hypothetical protein